MKPGVVTLLVNGFFYEGWKHVEVTRSVKEMAGKFSLKVSERWTGGNDGPSSLMGWQIRPGDACVLLYDMQPIITGFVDAYNPRYSKDQHEVTIQGRSKTGDLCDSSAEADVDKGEMNKVNLEQVARKAIAKYGIRLQNKADTSEIFDTVRVNPGETVHEFLERYARPGAVALTDNPQGDLVLMHVLEGAPVAALVEGVNILEASAILRADNRFSDYEVKGQDRGTDQEFGKPVAQRKAQVKDPAVKRHRPFRLLNETKTSKQNAKSRAAWEASARAGESTRAEIKVVDWRAETGKLWTPGDIVAVVSPMLAINRPLAIESARYTQDEQGTITQLALVPPEALNPKGKGSSSKSDGVWNNSKPPAQPGVVGVLPNAPY